METPRPMPSLPGDIIADILSRLPIKFLLRCRCVSNPWRNLISSPSFAKLHLRRTTQHKADTDHHTILISWFGHSLSLSYFVYINYNASEPYSKENYAAWIKFPLLNLSRNLKVLGTFAPELPIMGPNPNVKVFGSCDGLLFLRINLEHLILWNPSTRNSKVLPKPGFSRRQFAIGGFGFDHSTDDYKVVIGSYIDVSDHTSLKVEVFTLKTNTWRMVQDSGNVHFRSKAGTLFNGALHWLKGLGDNKKEDDTIMSFDLAQEQFRELVPLPHSSKKDGFMFIELVILQGCLCLYGNGNDKHNEVWAMKEYGVKSSWSKLFSVSFESDIAYHYQNHLKPICNLKKDEILLDLDGKELVRYNLKDNKYKRLCIHDTGVWTQAVAYVESLVSVY